MLYFLDAKMFVKCLRKTMIVSEKANGVNRFSLRFILSGLVLYRLTDFRMRLYEISIPSLDFDKDTVFVILSYRVFRVVFRVPLPG